MITFLQLGKYGRLGNQLFQIAATIGTAVKHGQSYLFPEWQYMESFILPTKPISSLIKYTWENYQEPSFTYTEINPKYKTNLSGYFQSEKYFEHCKTLIHSTIINDITIWKKDALEFKYHDAIIGATADHACCAVHIRRGDYLGLPNHYVQLTNTSYYKDAMLALSDKVDHFLIFSDDIAWCKENLHVHNCTFSKETDPIDDLLLMSACDYHIIANSSFSWWGSWLSRSQNVIAPKRWFGPAINHNTKDLYRPEMILI